MVIKKNRVLVQIGTNNGADEFNLIVRKTQPSKVVLVEPNTTLNKEIYDNYVGIHNMFLENVAITAKHKRSALLVVPDIRERRRKINGVHHYRSGLYSLIPMDNWGNQFRSFRARAVTFNELCRKHKLTKIHFLQIDTEGYDSEIIKSIDFNKVDIDIIKYEKWMFGEECYTRYGSAGKLYGANGMKAVAELLQAKGYKLTEQKLDIIAVKEHE